MVKHLTGIIEGMPDAFASAFGFVCAPSDAVAKEIQAWRTSIGQDIERIDVRGGLVDAARQLLPLQQVFRYNELVVSTRSADWTAYFDDDAKGGDPRPPMGVLGRRMGVPTLVIYATPFQNDPDAIPGMLGGVQLSYDPADGGPARSISVIQGEGSGRYYYEDFGPVQQWEKPENYSQRRKRDRFTTELLEEYCLSLGIDLFNVDFYRGPSTIIRRIS